jgi:hypothetical protein
VRLYSCCKVKPCEQKSAQPVDNAHVSVKVDTKVSVVVLLSALYIHVSVTTDSTTATQDATAREEATLTINQ